MILGDESTTTTSTFSTTPDWETNHDIADATKSSTYDDNGGGNKSASINQK